MTIPTPHDRRRAAAVLGVPPDATPAAARAALLRRLPAGGTGRRPPPARGRQMGAGGPRASGPPAGARRTGTGLDRTARPLVRGPAAAPYPAAGARGGRHPIGITGRRPVGRLADHFGYH